VDWVEEVGIIVEGTKEGGICWLREGVDE